MSASRKSNLRSRNATRYRPAPITPGRCAAYEAREDLPSENSDVVQLDALSALVLARPVHGHPGSQAEWVRSLEMRLAEQDRLIAQLSRLKQFVPRQIVDVVLSDDAEQLLKSHRREIVVVFVDLRGFTLFAETAAPEDLAEVLAQYHCDVGRAAAQFGGTLERFAGDGIMIFFNDPVPIAEPAVRAIQMALHLQAQLLALCAQWRNLGVAT